MKRKNVLKLKTHFRLKVVLFIKYERQNKVYNYIQYTKQNDSQVFDSEMYLTPNKAAGFAHFMKPTLVLIVSFVAVKAASVAFRCPFVLHEARIIARCQFGK